MKLDKYYTKMNSRGRITIPLCIRQKLSLTKGNSLRIHIERTRIIAELATEKKAPYRTYSKEDIDNFLQRNH